ncbi:hypothetical protein EDB80DRAFT_813326 [Ilyonectria destructans]|nr:hypothetical protein EDB80DRAFT_813326 [Ilyonectria destructans]
MNIDINSDMHQKKKHTKKDTPVGDGLGVSSSASSAQTRLRDWPAGTPEEPKKPPTITATEHGIILRDAFDACSLLSCPGTNDKALRVEWCRHVRSPPEAREKKNQECEEMALSRVLLRGLRPPLSDAPGKRARGRPGVWSGEMTRGGSSKGGRHPGGMGMADYDENGDDGGGGGTGLGGDARGMEGQRRLRKTIRRRGNAEMRDDVALDEVRRDSTRLDGARTGGVRKKRP